MSVYVSTHSNDTRLAKGVWLTALECFGAWGGFLIVKCIAFGSGREIRQRHVFLVSLNGCVVAICA